MNTLFDGEKAFKHIEKLAVEIGARPGGSPEDQLAAEYIKRYFEELGLDVSTQEFNIKTGYVVNQSLEITEPYSESVTCKGLSLIGHTGSEGVTGELVHIETTDEEYLTPEITGKIVVTSGIKRKNIEKIAALKPLGFIFIENYPRVLPKHFWGNYPQDKEYGNFPSVRIGFEDGLKLLKNNATHAKIVVQSEKVERRTQNIIAELKGTTNPDEIILVGGHYDTVPDVRGASDNAGGTSITMEIARVFKEKGSKRTLRFIAWGSEEMGLDGSNLYAKKLKEDDKKAKENDKEAKTELDKTLLSVNLDVHGALIGTNAASILGPSILTDSVKLLSKETGTVYDVKETVYSSDGTPLSAVGVPSASFSRRSGIDIMMHSIEDVIEYLSPKALETQGRFIETWMTRYITEAAAFPFEKEIPEKLKKEIENYYREWKEPLP
jgi:aminopeptidase YwaD